MKKKEEKFIQPGKKFGLEGEKLLEFVESRDSWKKKSGESWKREKEKSING